MVNQQQVDLRKYLSQPALRLLKETIDSHAKFHQTKALEAAMEANRYTAKLEAANAELMQAQRFQAALDVIVELETAARAETPPFQTAKVT